MRTRPLRKVSKKEIPHSTLDKTPTHCMKDTSPDNDLHSKTCSWLVFDIEKWYKCCLLPEYVCVCLWQTLYMFLVEELSGPCLWSAQQQRFSNEWHHIPQEPMLLYIKHNKIAIKLNIIYTILCSYLWGQEVFKESKFFANLVLDSKWWNEIFSKLSLKWLKFSSRKRGPNLFKYDMLMQLN